MWVTLCNTCHNAPTRIGEMPCMLLCISKFVCLSSCLSLSICLSTCHRCPYTNGVIILARIKGVGISG